MKAIRRILVGVKDPGARSSPAVHKAACLAERIERFAVVGVAQAQHGRLVGEHWSHQRTLHPAIPTPLIDTMIADATAAGALGGKALGASGGGCVVAIAAEGREDEVRRAMARHAQVLLVRVAREGFHVVRRTETVRTGAGAAPGA